MNKTLLFIFAIIAFQLSGQDKDNYVHYNQLTELKGTDYVLATIENAGKMFKVNSKYLLFINTRNGETKQIDFPKDAYIGKIVQVKLDSLGINKVVVSANTVNLDQDKSIDWNDPTQIIVLSTDGQEKVQLTEDNFFVKTWTINSQTGAIVITGYVDSNDNKKYDKTDQNKILIYDLKTLKLVASI